MRRLVVAAAGVLALGPFAPSALADPVQLQAPTVAPVGGSALISAVFSNPGSTVWFSSFRIDSTAPFVSITTTSNVTCFNFLSFVNCTATLASAGATGRADVLIGPIPSGATTVSATGTSTSGPYTLTKVINGVVPGVPTALAFTTHPSDSAAGAAIAPAVQVEVRDAFGDRATSASSSVSLSLGTNPAGATLSGTTTVAAVNGVATFSNLSLDKAGGGYTLVASVVGLPSATSNAFAVAAGPPAALVITAQPSTTTVGAAIAPPVQAAAVDTFGNLVTSFSGQVSAALGSNAGGATLAGTTTVTATAGVATFADLALDRPGFGYTLVTGASGLTGVTTAAFDVVASTPAQLAFVTQPSDVRAGTTMAPAVQVAVRDALGNPTTSTIAVTLALAANPGGSMLLGTRTVNAVGGIATFPSLALNKVGSGYTLAASASGLTGATSAPFAVTAGPAAQVRLVTQPSDVRAGSAIAPAVQVAIEDVFGNQTAAAQEVTVALASNPGGSTLSGSRVVSAAGGVATFADLSLNRVGSGYTLAASAPGLVGATSAAFAVTAGAPAQLRFVTQPSDVDAGAAIAPPVEVVVEDAFGNRAGGAATAVALALAANPSGANVSGTTAAAAADGVASFPDLSVDRAGVGYTLSASAIGLAGATSEPFTVQQPEVELGGRLELVVGREPAALAAGDLNGDGRVDLAVLNAGDGTVSALLNTTVPGSAGASFAARRNFATGSGGEGVALADLNADERPDLVVLNDRSVVTRINTTATGASPVAFGARATRATRRGGEALAVADLNGDDRPDLIVLNDRDDTVAAFVNTTAARASTATFGPRMSVGSGGAAQGLAVGDLNGDGRVDVAVLNERSVVTLINTTPVGATAAAFGGRAQMVTPRGGAAVALGDVNLDGAPDLVLANERAGLACAYVNTTLMGAPRAAFGTRHDLAAAPDPEALAVGDVNGDSRVDVVVVIDERLAGAFLNTTAPESAVPSFGERADIVTGRGTEAVITADLNGDGRADIVVANERTNRASAFLSG